MNRMQVAQLTVERNGWDAHKDGKPEQSCPYLSNSFAPRAWRRGWQKGKDGKPRP